MGFNTPEEVREIAQNAPPFSRRRMLYQIHPCELGGTAGEEWAAWVEYVLQNTDDNSRDCLWQGIGEFH